MPKSLIVRVRVSCARGRSGASRWRGGGKMAPLRPTPSACADAQDHAGTAAINAGASAASTPAAIHGMCGQYGAPARYRRNRGLDLSSPASRQWFSSLRASAARRFRVCASVAIVTDVHPARGTAPWAGTGGGEFARAGGCTTASGLFDATRERGMGHPAG